MSQKNSGKNKNWKAINSRCKMGKISDGKPAIDCPKCKTNHKLLRCPFCGEPREGKLD